MKRCPECRRDYYDDTLLYCLDDGNALLEGPATRDEPATAILAEFGVPPLGGSSSESPTRAPIHTTDQTAIFPRGSEAESQKNLGDLSERQSLFAHQAAKPQAKVGGRHRQLAGIGIAVLLLVAGFFGYLYFTPTKQIESIAVMPFQNASGSVDTEYLSDGISEALINSLTELQQLKVIARSTAFRYKGKEIDPQTVGRELSVGAVLMGRVRQVGDSLNVQVDLVDAATGAQLWGKEYERKASDVLSVKQAITREVTENLKLRLSGEQQQQLTKRDTTNPEAYQFYLRGRYFWNKRTADGIKKAVEEFQQAIDRDPNYALGYVGLADCYSILNDYTGADGGAENAKAYAERALQLDDSLAEAHASLASVYDNEWRWGDAEREFKRSIELNPNYPTARHWYGTFLRDAGRTDEAMAEMKRAQELDPLSPIINQNVALLYVFQGELDKAAEQYEKIIELNPSFPGAHAQLGFYVYLIQERFDDAIAKIHKGVDLSGRSSWLLASLANAYGKAGKKDAALMVIQELLPRHEKHEANEYVLAIAYAGLGDPDKVFVWLEKSFAARSGSLRSIKTEFAFENTIRDDPRYADLVRRIGRNP